MMKKSHEEDVDFEPEEDSSRLVEDEAELVGEAAATAKLKKLRDELEKVKRERQEYLDGWQRCKADAINARTEMLREAERRGERARDTLVEELIPALDSFEMATASEQWEKTDAGFRTGMERVRDLILETFAAHGVERFGAVGEQFDPTLHEAIQTDADASGQEHEIVRVIRSGYRTPSRVIRPAQVVIKS